MKNCFSMEVVDLDNQAPNRNRRESKYFWDEMNHLTAAGGFHSIEIPYEPKWDFGGRSGIPRTLRSVTTKFGTVAGYMDYLKQNGIDAIDCIHFNPSLFCRGIWPVYFGAFAHYAMEAVGFAKETGCGTVVISATPPAYKVQLLLGDKTEGEFLQETRKVLEEIAAFAAQNNVSVCLKNEYWGLLRGDRILSFLSDMKQPVKLDLDTAHLAAAGVEVSKFAKKAAAYIGMVHFTDTSFRDEDGTWKTALPEHPAGHAAKVFTDPGEGTVDLKGIRDELTQVGYDGIVVWNPKDSYDISRSILRTRYFIDTVLE